ncbi:MAG TPA: ATP synthase F1 subunit gamma [Fimbriimonadaceae bacterium]|nr:ATP synthase F1 subunit gamma [Fimbriimonadaceae bacterium]HRJ95332.1 ATP synthase F1 subunit gamma [Fimbriimonadaceae bacterium]
MATLKQIRQRIKTSKSIQQITRAMKLVAAARLKKAQDRVLEARPYSDKMRDFMTSISGAGDLPAHPLLEKRPVQRACLILVTADRGLAGSYNTNLIRKAWDFLRAQTVPTDLICVGKKGGQFLSKRGYSVLHQITVPTSGARVEDAREVTRLAREVFESGEVDAVYVCYSKFYSPIRQVPQIVQLLPIEPVKSEGGAAAKNYIYEPGPEELLGTLLPKYLSTLIYQALLEATASEHGSRMTAMTSATDNAGKMIQQLTLTANRARQAGITKEILEVVGGAEALKS